VHEIEEFLSLLLTLYVPGKASVSSPNKDCENGQWNPNIMPCFGHDWCTSHFYRGQEGGNLLNNVFGQLGDDVSFINLHVHGVDIDVIIFSMTFPLAINSVSPAVNIPCLASSNP